MNRKILAVVLVLGLCFCGCAAIQTAVTAVQTMLCNPTDVQKAEANAAKNFIAYGVGFVGPLAGVPITADMAMTILDKVQSSVCVALADLQLAIDYFDALNSAVQSKAKKMGAKAFLPTAPDVSALKSAVK